METDRVGGWRLGCFRICAGNHLEGDFYLYTGDVGAAHSVGVSVEKNLQQLEETTWQRDEAMHSLQVIGLEGDKSPES